MPEGAVSKTVFATPGMVSFPCSPQRREAMLHFGPPLVPHIVPRGSDHCDFCCTSPVFTVYACTNFVLDGNPVFARGLAVGSWAACRKCAELVNAGKWADLTERALRKFAKRHGVCRHEISAVRTQFAGIHRLFAKHVLKDS
jgi:hypothetical protein